MYVWSVEEDPNRLDFLKLQGRLLAGQLAFVPRHVNMFGIWNGIRDALLKRRKELHS